MIHRTYTVRTFKVNEVNHLINIGDIVITSGKLCACDPCNLEDKSRNQEMDLIVPTGIYPVLLDTKEHLVNIMFNPRGDIFFWEDIKFKRNGNPNSIDVDTGFYGFTDKDGINGINKNIKKGICSSDFYVEEGIKAMGKESYNGSFEINITDSKNNFLCISTSFGDDVYTFHAGYNESNKIVCISGCLLGENSGIDLY